MTDPTPHESPPGAARRSPTSTPPPDDAALREAMNRVRIEVGKAVIGQDGTVTGLLIALLARGHVLLEGVPGVAKTLLVRSFSGALGLDTKRIQFTPDLMPGDVSGSLVYDARAGEFEFREGPVFTNVVLADEINRTPPKTQSALLEAMEERQVSTDGVTRPLPDPFLVAATQNPIEQEGTYTLPEAQLDRFLLKLIVDIPAARRRAGGAAPPRGGVRPAQPRRGRAAAGGDRGRDPRGAAGRGIRHRRRRRPRVRRRPRAGHPPQPLGAARASAPAPRPRCWPPPRPGRGSAATPRSRPTTCRRCSCRRGATASGCARTPNSRASRSTPCSARCCSRPACRSDDVRHRSPPPPRRRRRGARRAAGDRRRRRVDLGGRAGSCCARSWRSRMPLPPRIRAASACSVASPGARCSARTSRPSCGCRTPARAACADGCATHGSRRPARRRTRPAVDLPAGERRRLVVPLLPRRRGELSSEFVVVRSDGPLRLRRAAGADSVARCAARAAALHRAPASAVAARAAAGARRQHERAGARSGHRVRQPARVRARRRRALDRLAGDRAGGHDHAAHLAARARPPRRDRHRHRAHGRRPRGRRRATGCRDGGRAAARRPRHPRRRPHAPADVRPGHPRPRHPRRRSRRCCRRSSTRWRRSSRS